MRAKLAMPTTPWRRRMTGAAIVAIPASAAALTAGQAVAANATPDSVPARVRAHHIDFGESLRVSGALPAADAGHKLELEFRAAGRSGWQPLASSTSHSDGHY